MTIKLKSESMHSLRQNMFYTQLCENNALYSGLQKTMVIFNLVKKMLNEEIMDRSFIEKTDAALIRRDVPLHARPFHVVTEWMKANRISGDVLSPEIWEPLMAIYRQLYPTGDFSVPSMLEGFVGFRDRAYG